MIEFTRFYSISSYSNVFTNLILLLISFKSENYIKCDSDVSPKLRLSDMDVLILYKDKLTTGRRLNPVPQLKCVGIRCGQFSPYKVECFNRKQDDAIDVNWECKADLDKRVKFGYLKVNCEGYDYEKDEFILAGSCGLEYSLESAYRTSKTYDLYNKELYETSKLSNFLTLLVMIVIILAVYKSCTKYRENEPRHDINGTYAHIVHNSESNFVNSANVYPPPPPPYAFTTGATVTAVATNATTNTTATTTTTNLLPPSLNANNSILITNPNLNTNEFKPEFTNEHQNNEMIGFRSNILGANTTTNVNWTDNSRRSESPPPPYHQDLELRSNPNETNRR